MTEPAQHGTDTGYQRHRRQGEKPCDECLKAHAEYTRDYNRRRAAEPSKPLPLGTTKLRDRALIELASRHPQEYRGILAGMIVDELTAADGIDDGGES